MKQAIQKAIEGGWTSDYRSPVFTKYSSSWIGDYIVEKGWQTPTSDPLFWQALGKAMGWDEYPSFKLKSDIAGGTFCQMEGWRARWFQFIDHLAEGKDAEEFFRELLA